MEKNDADLRFAFGVTAMTTDRNASSGRRQSALKFGLDYFSLSLVLNSVWTHTFYRKRKKKLHTSYKVVSLLRGRIISWCCNISAKLKGNSHLSTLTLIQ